MHPSSRLCALLALITVSVAAHAAPAAPAEPTPDKLQQIENTLVQGLQEAGQTVSNGADMLVSNALGFLGVPYRRGGESAETGVDCSGLVRSVYEQTLGLVLPRVAAQQAAATETIEKKDLQPGDLVFFNTMRRAFSHVGIYIGNDEFVHAPRTGHPVRIEKLSLAYWKKRFNGARRVSADTAVKGQD